MEGLFPRPIGLNLPADWDFNDPIDMSAPKQRGYKVTIHLVDGTPDGLRIVEKSNWTGRGVVYPRPNFSSVRLRAEFGKTGVYVLVGPADDAGLPQIYIGEGDPVLPRLDSHIAKKDFWTTGAVFISKDENLNKAHVQYLEARLVQLARDARRCVLDNGNVPQLPSLSEADVDEVEGFLDEMRRCFPLIGLNVFEKPAEPAPNSVVLKIEAKGVVARGYESANGFTVKKGSEFVAHEVPSAQRFLVALRKSLVENGTVKAENGKLVFVQDYEFDSPSSAAGVVLGRSSNGRVEWKTVTGKTLKDLQQEIQPAG